MGMSLKPSAANADFTLSEAECELLLRALIIPTCWDPRLRDEAAEIVKSKLASQLSLLAEGAR
jgi:hypothetical protein